MTALYLWWPKLRNLWRSLTWQKRIRTSQNLHFVFGIWSLIPALILAVTGIYLSFPDASARMVSVFTTINEPIALQEPKPARALDALRLGPADAIERARAEVGDDAVLMRLAMPSVGSEDWFVMLKPQDAPPSASLVNDATGEVIKSPPPAEPAPGDGFTHVMHALHDGLSYGLWYQVIIVITGLLPLMLLITGVMLWLRRRSIRRRAELARK